MNNINPFLYPYNGFQMNNYDQNEIERIINKLERIEKDIRIIDNRLNKLENNYKPSNNTINDISSDMYII